MLKKIGEDAFYQCTSLSDIKLPNGLERIGKCCFQGSGLNEFTAPYGLKEIGYKTFYGCHHLRRVVLNEGLRELKDYHYNRGYYGVFEDSGIGEIVLPNTMERVDKYTFNRCENLRTIYVRDGCKADLSKLVMRDSVKIVLLKSDNENL